jgi:hypothetical protein
MLSLSDFWVSSFFSAAIFASLHGGFPQDTGLRSSIHDHRDQSGYDEDPNGRFQDSFENTSVLSIKSTPWPVPGPSHGFLLNRFSIPVRIPAA